MKSVQFIHNENGDVEYAVMPIAHYRALTSGGSDVEDPHPLLTKDKTAIKLPYGGPGTCLIIEDLVQYLKDHGINHLAINQRAQVLTAYPKEQEMTLDPIIRREFLAPDSSYRNTMQATVEVVDALVSTGRFRRTKKRYDFFNRAVNALELVV
ncbi:MULTISPECIES: hypothetical protein [Pseudomonas]|uniref:hypothetical protein n=1 Tax=Pseudomonas TaxID=286 RepID=UPI0027385179|nr:hypothetical protein [Pseudomonas putida]WLP03758.1 hypothetical protein Q8015_17730 [Pseudomonas putida]